MSKQKLQARVYSRTAPTEEQLAQLRDFLHQKYQRPVNLHWERDDRMKDGFRLELGEGESRELVYDWSSSGKSRQLKDKIAAAIRSRSDVIPLLRKTLEDFQPEASATEIGTVLSYGDGIAEVSGLPGAEYGEILIFENGVRGMVLDLKEKSIGCVVFAGEAAVQALAAGCDMILMPSDLQGAFDAVKAAVADGTLTQSRIDESVLRILTVKAEYGIIS